jgi:hypothetical protein
LKKVQETLSALQGRSASSMKLGLYLQQPSGRVNDLHQREQELTVALNEVKGYSGENNGPPVTSGPLGPGGPMINGMPIDVPATPVSTPPQGRACIE